MKLYIIKPSEKWHYCGGGGAIIAEDFKEAQEMLLKQKDEKLYYSESEVEDNYSCWIKVEDFRVSGESKRIVLLDYNWA